MGAFGGEWGCREGHPPLTIPAAVPAHGGAWTEILSPCHR